jgi:hypothetical protein
LGNFDGNGSALLKWEFVARTTSTTGTFAAVVYNVTDAAEVPYTQVSIANGDKAYQTFFTPVSGKTYKLRIKEVSATTGFISIDAVKLQRGDYPVFGGLQRFQTTTTTNNAALAVTHGLGGEPQSMSFFYFDGTDKNAVDASSVVVTKSTSTVTLNTTAFDFTGGKYLEVIFFYQADGDHLVSPMTQFRSAWFTGTGTTTVPHGLADMDSIHGYSVIEWDVTGNTRRVVGGLIDSFDRNNFYLDWTGFSPSATLQYCIVAGGAALPHALPSTIGGFTKFVGFGPGSYLTLAAALSAAAAGDRILVKASETLASTVTISLSDIEIVWMPGTVMSVLSSITKGIVVSGDRVKLIGPRLLVNFSGTLAAGVEVSGDDCSIERAYTEVNNAGLTVTAGFAFTATAQRNYANASIKKTAGTVTNNVTDAGSDNDYSVRG